jgi:hypothetical protein
MAAVFIAVTITRPCAAAQVAPPGEATQYEITGKGALVRHVATLRLSSVAIMLEIRNLVIGPGGADAIVAPERAIFELRSGGLITTIDGKEEDRRIGDFWTVGKGRSMRVKSHTQASVIRAIFLYEGPR